VVQYRALRGERATDAVLFGGESVVVAGVFDEFVEPTT
jgi:hypothetical protein